MTIKRYTANADTTITNAFEANLTTRGTGSNMGLSDILEVFSIYGQTISGSNATNTAELSRIIPVSGSVSFFLRMFNAKHSFTVPRSYTLSASAVTADWEEGNGLDMEGYRDLTYDNTGSNWMNANGNLAAATLANAIDTTGVDTDAFTMTVPVAAGGDGVAHKFTIVALDSDVPAGSANAGFAISQASTGGGVAATVAAAIIDAINGTVNAAVGYNGGVVETVLAAGSIGLTAALTAGETLKITLSMDDTGVAGNVVNVLAANTGFAEGTLLLTTTFTGGDGPWARPGGDYDRYPTSSFEQSFVHGTEDLEMDVTKLMEQWLYTSTSVLGDKSSARYGIGIHLTSSQEAKYVDTTITDGDYGLLKNPTGSIKSYYTKKFFARGSQYFFKRPIIEARWDSSKKDNRGNFYLSSSLVPAADNLNTLYLYNYVRGQLKNIPKLGGPGAWVNGTVGGTLDNVTKTKLNVRIYTSLTGSDAKTLPLGGGVTVADEFVVTASYVASGTYSASFAYTGALTTIYDVWSTGSNTSYRGSGAAYKEFHTGSGISVKSFNSYDYNPNDTYVTSIPNLKSIYSTAETARFRLFTRKKDWNPTIYTKASAEAETEIIEDAYYKVFRIYDDLTVINYGTGSLNHTRTSYDISGSYFDLSMSMLEADYMYGIKIIYYLNGKYVEQPKVFKFRVEKDLTNIE